MKSNNPVVSSVIKDYTYSQRAFLPRIVTVPLSQEDGVSYNCLVNPGDVVKEGSIIAVSEGTKSRINIHSPLPGTVTEISKCFSPDGKKDSSVKIKFRGSLSYLGKKHNQKELDSVSKNSIIDILADFGVINTFRTEHPENLGVQIKSILEGNERRNLVVRLFDEDPYRITDSLMAKFFFDQIVTGARFAAKAIEAKGIVFAIDNHFHDKELFNKTEYNDIRALEMNIRRYPCGTPREIVSSFDRGSLKRSCTFTLSKKDLFCDASTIYEVYKAVALGIPSIDKYVHFSGDCLNASCLLEVKLGTTLRDIVSQIGGFAKEPALVVVNGLLCGNSVHSLDVPITKYVKSVEFSSKNRVIDEQIHTCINCGNCRSACPVKLSPDILYNNTVYFKRLPENFAASSLACIECGLCNTVCPARLPLCQIITVLKHNLTEQ